MHWLCGDCRDPTLETQARLAEDASRRAAVAAAWRAAERQAEAHLAAGTHVAAAEAAPAETAAVGEALAQPPTVGCPLCKTTVTVTWDWTLPGRQEP